MPNANWRSSAAMALLFALLVPILAACGGAASTPAADATAPAGAVATAAPADAPTAAPADAPTAAPEAPAAGGTGTAEAGVLRIPRAKQGVKWDADRGKDVATAPWFKLGPKFGEPEGTRINDHHLSLAEKQAERDKVVAKLKNK